MEHHFNVDHARVYGIEEAIFINNLQFWITKNKASGKHLYDERTWTYNSMEAFSQLFPYMSFSRIRNTISSLIKQGVIISGNYNKKKFDRTAWYAFADESIFLNEQIHLSKSANASAENSEPIPYSKPDIKTDGKLFEGQEIEADASQVQKKEKPGTKEKEPSTWNLMIDAWIKFNDRKAKEQNIAGFKPVVNGRECKALKEIAAVLKRITESSGGEWNHETALASLNVYFEAAWSKDDWLRKNFTLSNLNSQLNSILKILTHGGQQPKQSNSVVSKQAAGTIAHLDELYKRAQ